jgi:hypothetical protein
MGKTGGNPIDPDDDDIEVLADRARVHVAPIRATPKRPFGQPIGSHLDYAGDTDRRLLGQVASSIDAVHGDGRLVRMSVRLGRLDDGIDGLYEDLARQITINPAGPYLRMAMLHEVGHLVDARAFEGHSGSAQRPASIRLALFAAWRAAMIQSRPVRSYRLIAEDLRQRIARDTASDDDREDLIFIDYLTDVRELWARSYVQYIAIHATDDRLVSEWRQYQGEDAMTGLPQQWDDVEFEPIARSVDHIFRQQGWRR